MLTTSLLLLLTCSPSLGTDPVTKALKTVSSKRLMANVETLVAFGTRHSSSDTTSDVRGIGAARIWLTNELRTISQDTGGYLEVEQQPFEADVRGEQVEMMNIYGFLPARSGELTPRTYLVSGHYDSRVLDGTDAISDAPGADDDASGTAVVLELARVLSSQAFEANLIFLCADGEELGLFGSRHFAEWVAEQGLELDGMLTNDIVGGVEGGNGIVDKQTVRCFSGAQDGLHSVSRELARTLCLCAERYLQDTKIQLVLRQDRFGRGGDHIPFEEAGWPALRITEANENYARQHQDVRLEGDLQYGDLPRFVSGEYMARVARVNGACLMELALAPPAPEQPRMRAAMRYDSQLTWAPVEGAAGYELVWRKTTEARWSGSMPVGPQTTQESTRRGERTVVRAVVPGISADGYFFGVRSVSKDGHRSRVVIPTRP